jgi:hypothetical protein
VRLRHAGQHCFKLLVSNDKNWQCDLAVSSVSCSCAQLVDIFCFCRSQYVLSSCSIAKQLGG